ncbi:hypothetical protein CGLO_00738 [Colletotrichum gloeosporioides Cg-14]|uniref:Uncharacterized protein n=1 Tax=Colletotrichum gloeosporioides (strain Cg-14) TaxID=1237896 RepID=T0L3E2_COLGC|nr:hypothetical protein CGLO_00738 [Colletotrichum gloeosporioides Cg-14]
MFRLAVWTAGLRRQADLEQSTTLWPTDLVQSHAPLGPLRSKALQSAGVTVSYTRLY